MVPHKKKSMDSTAKSDDPDEFVENPSPLICRSPAPPPHPSLPILFQPRRSQANRRFSFNFVSNTISFVLQSILQSCHSPSLCVSTSSSSSSSRRRCLTGTLFGPRKGRVTFAVQTDPKSPPDILLELAFQTSHLVQEMASGTVRILLECEKKHHLERKNTSGSGCTLWDEPVWTMYCNGRRTGFAVSRKWGENDKHVFGTVGTVSAGAGVLPPLSPSPAGMKIVEKTETTVPILEGLYGGDESMEMMFMRAKFERVVGGKDSEAFYMMSPDGGGGGPELSLFLLRL